ncbi:hypothetical protein J437_LFUL003613 [Ladona fulva]|uniref:Transposase n=1 Tax=Ladona fulva TaxID=123851 RepID=A0A8K0KI75_LADFU|nr:hypothetical protein J437_LFUL003613 [Ladona fulva]
MQSVSGKGGLELAGNKEDHLSFRIDLVTNIIYTYNSQKLEKWKGWASDMDTMYMTDGSAFHPRRPKTETFKIGRRKCVVCTKSGKRKETRYRSTNTLGTRYLYLVDPRSEQYHSQKRSIQHSVLSPFQWKSDDKEGIKAQVSKGQRLIIVHGGGEMGFIPEALLIFKLGLKTGDYHGEMNSGNYLKWIKNQLIPNLPPKSLVVIDNAPYHNV